MLTVVRFEDYKKDALISGNSMKDILKGWAIIQRQIQEKKKGINP